MMRNEKTIQIGNQDVTVYELSATQIGRVVGIIDGMTQLKTDADFMGFISQNWNDVMDLLSGATSLEGEIKDIGGAALVEILKAFTEVNRPFFSGLKELAPGTAMMAVKGQMAEVQT